MGSRRAADRTTEMTVTPIAVDTFGDAQGYTDLMRRAVIVSAQRRRQTTNNTKTRGEVAGSTAKLYRQKGTGKARAGSARAVQRRGGGVVFGPRTRVVRHRLARRERREALRCLLAHKAHDEKIHVIDSWGPQTKTKERAAWLAASGFHGRVLLLDQAPSEALRRSSRNIPGVNVQRADAVGFMEIAVADYVVATDDALKVLRGARNE